MFSNSRRLLKPAIVVVGTCLITYSHRAVAADAMHPTVVEIFQSQGCSACPPANANVLKLADRSDILILSWQVTYWDYLGWRDTFGSPTFTQRQRDYALAFDRADVFTPEVVVNGRADVVGNRMSELEALIDHTDRGSSGPTIAVAMGQIEISSQSNRPTEKSIVELVRYNPSLLQVPVGAGENQGRTLPHLNVVREVTVIGEYDGGVKYYAIPTAQEPGLASAVIVQAGRGGVILAAEKMSVLGSL